MEHILQLKWRSLCNKPVSYLIKYGSRNCSAGWVRIESPSGPWLVYSFFSVVPAVPLIFRLENGVFLCGHPPSHIFTYLFFPSLFSYRTLREHLRSAPCRCYVDPPRLASLTDFVLRGLWPKIKKSSGRKRERGLGRRGEGQENH